MQEAVLPLSVVAVTVTVPGFTAVILPEASTVAIEGSLEVQVTFLSTASVGVIVAVKVSLAPTVKLSVVLFSDIVVLESFTLTAQEEVKLLPSLVVAVIIAEPAFTAVTLPKVSTLAIEGSLEVQVSDLSGALSGTTTCDKVSVCPTVNVSDVLFKVKFLSS